MHHDPTFWLLARASGLTAYVVLTLSVLAGLVLKSRPFQRLRAPSVAEVHKTLALHGPRRARTARRLARARHDREGLAGLLVPGLVTYRPAAVAAGVVAALAARRSHCVVLVAATHRNADVAPPALVHLRALRRSRRSTESRQAPTRRGRGQPRSTSARSGPSSPRQPGAPFPFHQPVGSDNHERSNTVSSYRVTIDPPESLQRFRIPASTLPRRSFGSRQEPLGDGGHGGDRPTPQRSRRPPPVR